VNDIKVGDIVRKKWDRDYESPNLKDCQPYGYVSDITPMGIRVVWFEKFRPLNRGYWPYFFHGEWTKYLELVTDRE
jgi:hypothetical protein